MSLIETLLFKTWDIDREKEIFQKADWEIEELNILVANNNHKRPNISFVADNLIFSDRNKFFSSITVIGNENIFSNLCKDIL